LSEHDYRSIRGQYASARRKRKSGGKPYAISDDDARRILKLVRLQPGAETLAWLVQKYGVCERTIRRAIKRAEALESAAQQQTS